MQGLWPSVFTVLRSGGGTANDGLFAERRPFSGKKAFRGNKTLSSRFLAAPPRRVQVTAGTASACRTPLPRRVRRAMHACRGRKARQCAAQGRPGQPHPLQEGVRGAGDRRAGGGCRSAAVSTKIPKFDENRRFTPADVLWKTMGSYGGGGLGRSGYGAAGGE